jgi:hypothetical protein
LEWTVKIKEPGRRGRGGARKKRGGDARNRRGRGGVWKRKEMRIARKKRDRRSQQEEWEEDPGRRGRGGVRKKNYRRSQEEKDWGGVRMKMREEEPGRRGRWKPERRR